MEPRVLNGLLCESFRPVDPDPRCSAGCYRFCSGSRKMDKGGGQQRPVQPGVRGADAGVDVPHHGGWL